jgi:ABC-type nitrate/sulfonate/bicarbonate transport system permease component
MTPRLKHSRAAAGLGHAGAFGLRLLLYGGIYLAIAAYLSRPAFPPLGNIGRALFGDVIRGFLEHFPATFVRWLMVYALGTTAGVLAGIPLGYFRRIHQHVRIDVDFFRSLPATILTTFILAAFKDGNFQRSLPTLYITFFTVVFYVSKHVSILDYRRIEHLRELGAGPFFIVRHCVLYEVLPAVFVAARQAVSLSFLVAISVELIIGPYGEKGLGRLFYDWQFYSKYANILGGLLVLGAVGYALNLAMLALHRTIAAWSKADAQAL